MLICQETSCGEFLRIRVKLHLDQPLQRVMKFFVVGIVSEVYLISGMSAYQHSVIFVEKLVMLIGSVKEKSRQASSVQMFSPNQQRSPCKRKEGKDQGRYFKIRNQLNLDEVEFSSETNKGKMSCVSPIGKNSTQFRNHGDIARLADKHRGTPKISGSSSNPGSLVS
ncbi:hypothetical protein ACH5RR_006979 [Cinchona calisaya]|uniref:Uncharacterized protein n=1 Tax=Cinchona calisaya TaxID=153742 RepID=A0ABD3AQK9_9GENT